MPNNEKSFEQALARLEEVVKLLEDGQLPLDEALKLFAEGIELGSICHQQLKEAERSINKLVESADGELILKETDLGGLD